MLGILQEAAGQGSFWPQELEGWVRVATPVLIAIGGVFAWFKFFRQGEHEPRLQATVTTEEVIVQDNVAYIIAKMSIENTGQVDVTLDLEPSGLYVVGRKAGDVWSDPDPDYTYDVFIGQSKVQVNATIEDKVWIERDLTGEVALSLQLAITGEGRDWHTSDIISLLDGVHLSEGG